MENFKKLKLTQSRKIRVLIMNQRNQANLDLFRTLHLVMVQKVSAVAFQQQPLKLRFQIITILKLMKTKMMVQYF
jgi:hypothetical protein